MAAINQIIGGNFQDAQGNLLANGYLLFELNQDAIVNTNTMICAGMIIQVPLDANGNVVTSPAYSFWTNDLITPINTSVGSYYLVSAYSAAGELVWGPISVQILSTPSPFNIGAWNQ